MTGFRSALIALGAVTIVAVAPAVVAAQGQSPTRIGYVAVQAVLQRTPGYAQADSIWTAEAAGYQRELTQLQSQMDTAAASFDQRSVMLSPSARAAEQKKLQDQAAALQQRVTELRQRAADRQRELLDPIEERVMAVIEGIRAEGNYAVIFDVSAQGSTIVAADKSLDITQRAIDRLTTASGND